MLNLEFSNHFGFYSNIYKCYRATTVHLLTLISLQPYKTDISLQKSKYKHWYLFIHSAHQIWYMETLNMLMHENKWGLPSHVTQACVSSHLLYLKSFICASVIKSVKVMVVWTFSGKTKMMRNKYSFVCWNMRISKLCKFSFLSELSL